MANEAAIRKVISFIEEEPQSLDMDYWAAVSLDCKTTYCLAGWACVLNGDKISWTGVWPARTTAINILTNFGLYRTIESRANEILGLTPEEGFQLFSYNCVTCEGPHLLVKHDGDPVKPTIDDLKRRITEVTRIEFK